MKLFITIARNKEIGAKREPGAVHDGIIDLNSVRTKLIIEENRPKILLLAIQTLVGRIKTIKAENQLKDKLNKDLGSNTENKLDIKMSS